MTSLKELKLADLTWVPTGFFAVGIFAGLVVTAWASSLTRGADGVAGIPELRASLAISAASISSIIGSACFAFLLISWIVRGAETINESLQHSEMAMPHAALALYITSHLAIIAAISAFVCFVTCHC